MCPSPAPTFRSLIPHWRGLSLCIVLLGVPLAGEARTISWGGAVMDENIQSDGQDITASFTFQLGYFERDPGSFEGPQADNIAQWSDYWRPIDQSLFREEFSFFSSMATILEDGTSDSEWAGDEVFPAGEQAYIWAYNTLAMVPTAEWALITNGLSDGDLGDDWLIPESSSTSLPLEWRVSGATEAIVGGLGNQRDGEGTAEVVHGAGGRTTDTDDFSFQTHRIYPLIIPEPSTSLMILMGLSVHLLRRRRPAHSGLHF